MQTKKFTLIMFLVWMSTMLTPLSAKEGDSHPKGIAGVDDAHWLNRLTISGVLEVEASKVEGFDGVDSSDIALATVELGFDARINELYDAYLSFLYEEDAAAYDVDEGYISIDMSPVYIQAGQMYVPFGSYETNMVSDSVVQEVSETRESSLLVGIGVGNLYASVYIFNGGTQESGKEDNVDQVGASLVYISERGGSIMDVGLDYINNIGNSINISSVIQANTGSIELSQYVAARIIHANFIFGSVYIMTEYLSTDKFAPSELAFGSSGAEIVATNVEVGYSMILFGKENTIAIAKQSTEEAIGLGLPKVKHLLALSINTGANTALSFEYANNTDYDPADGGTGKDANSITAQLAVGF